LAAVIQLAVPQAIHALRLYPERNPAVASGADKPLPIASRGLLVGLIELLEDQKREPPRKVQERSLGHSVLPQSDPKVVSIGHRRPRGTGCGVHGHTNI
jgi:hypothetical protein